MNPSDSYQLRPTDRVLITGASGLVGSALTTELRAAGYEDLLLVSSKEVDLTDWTSTRELIESTRADVVFHIAARVYGLMGNLENLGRAFTDNIRMNTNVIEGSLRSGVRKVVAMGSAAIYSDVVPLPMSEDDVWLGPPHDSERPYAQAKRAMLAQLEAYHQLSGMKFAYCVSTNLYGPNDRFDERWGHVIPSLVSKFHTAVQTGQPVVVWGTGAPTRDLLFSADAAHALRLIGESQEGIINLATGESHTIRDVVDHLAQISNYTGEVEWDHTKPDGQRQRAYDVGKLRALGFTPRWSLHEGLRTTYEWFAAHATTARR